MKAKFLSIAKDYENNKWQATLSFEGNEVIEKYQALRDKELNVEIKKAIEKRSINANDYYWRYSNILAAKHNISNEEMHNILLRSYGTIDHICGKPITVTIPDSDEAEEMTLHAATYHLKPTSQVREGRDGVMYRTYLMIKGSHEYNKEEMSRLIEGLVHECKNAGISTLTPIEVERMISAWKA